MKDEIKVGTVYTTTEEINGENQCIPNDCDFDGGVEFEVIEITKKCIIAKVSNVNHDNNEWAFDKKEFIKKTV